MKISEKFKSKKTVFSCEVFPPKKTSPIESIYPCLDRLAAINPDFISVTCGAAGSSAEHETTTAVSSYIENKLGVTACAHLTCIASSEQDIMTVMRRLNDENIQNILALRGDIPESEKGKLRRFGNASDLARFIRANGDFHISGACYPECHLEAESISADIKNLKKKIDAGVSHLFSQLFFDNSVFYSFTEKLDIAGIDVPVEAGIMPITNAAQIEKMVVMCGASLPPKFTRMMNKFGTNKEALTDAGIAYAVDQIADLIAAGVRGIHLYTMNNPYVAEKISAAVRSML
jgi:methylenetetrahydrofolate reductase (NADPH)